MAKSDLEKHVQETITAVWEFLDDEQKRQDQSHWRGVGRWTDDAKWRNVGQATLKRLKLLARALNRPFPETPVVLEWGPGGGPNLYAFRDIARAYVGVDISKKNLREAQRMLTAERGSAEFAPILIEGEPLSIAGSLPSIDLFLSTACFQHFPSKAYGEEVLRVIAAACVPSAFGLIQIRFDNGDAAWAPVEDIDLYVEKHIRATSYRIDEFWQLAKRAGLEPVFVGNVNPANNYATFYLKRASRPPG